MMQKLWVLGLALVLAGCVTKEVGNNPSSAADMNEAAELNMQLGVNYFRQGNLTAAREKLEKAIEQKPNLAGAHRILGLVYQEIGDPEEAETQYVKALKLSPNDPDSLNDYAGFLCFDKREVDKALTYFDKALKIPLNQNRTMLYSNAARCAMQTDPQRAENYLRTALASNRNNAALMVQMADLAYLQQQFLQARVFLERAMEITPPTPTMLYLLSKTEAQLGDIDKSRRYRAQLIELYPLSEEAVAIKQGN
jgi:type IV pilus assembly protein PilF